MTIQCTAYFSMGYRYAACVRASSQNASYAAMEAYSMGKEYKQNLTVNLSRYPESKFGGLELYNGSPIKQ